VFAGSNSSVIGRSPLWQHVTVWLQGFMEGIASNYFLMILNFFSIVTTIQFWP